MNEKNKQKNNNWKNIQIGKLFDYEQPTNYIVSSTDYGCEYKTPVLTAGKSFILGYTNETEGIFSKEKLPVIIFDDFTTTNKFVDFPFKVKSSAMKILKNKDEKISDIKFVFGWMSVHPFTVGQHKRNYLSEYQYQDVLLPPIDEQKRIVKVLEIWDLVIEKLERKIVVKEHIKKGLMQQLLTGKKRLPGFDGEWEKKTLEKIANVKMGQSPKSEYYNELDDGIPLIQGNADIKKQKTISHIFTSACTKIANFDDVILTVRAPVGEIGIVNQKEICIGRGVCSITANNKNSQDMIFYLLSYFKQQLRRFEQGSTFTAINSTDVKGFKIEIPKLKEQKAIAEILTTADEEIEVLRKKLDILKDQKKFLLNNLVTGQIRVPEKV